MDFPAGAAWNRALRNIIADCPAAFDSPDGRFAVRIASGNVVSVRAEPGVASVRWEGLRIEPPAMLSWSPTSMRSF